MDCRSRALECSCCGVVAFLAFACGAAIAAAQSPIVVSPLPIVVGPVQVGQSAQTIVTLTNTTDSATAIGVGVGSGANQLTDCDAIYPNFDTTHGPWPAECYAQRAEGEDSIHVSSIGCGNVAAHSTCSVIITFTPHVALPTAGGIQVGPADAQSTLPPEEYEFTAQALPAQTAPGTVLAVEYVDRDLMHFFVTAIPGEIQSLDDGNFPPWVRTGRSFWVYPPGNPVAAGESPVCRYFSNPDAGFNTHFYSAFPQECNAIPALFPGLWTLETMDAFGVLQPDGATGACPAGTSPLYRVYNGGPNVNHRYMASLDTRALMTGHLLDWTPEGYGPLGVGMCVPQ
jgi:hypothetical protein